MKSFKAFATENNISYEAVRQQIKRYAADLDGHIYREGRTQYLDDYAAQFLETKRKKNPVVIVEASKDEELAQLKLENKSLLLKLIEAQDTILQTHEQLLEATKSQQQLVSAQSEVETLQADLIEVKRQLSEKNDELARLRADLELAQSRKGFFSRFFGGR